MFKSFSSLRQRGTSRSGRPIPCGLPDRGQESAASGRGLTWPTSSQSSTFRPLGPPAYSIPTLFTAKDVARGLSQARRHRAGDGEGARSALVSEVGGPLTQDSNLQAPQSCLDGPVDLQAPGEIGLDDARGPAVKSLWRMGAGSGTAPALLCPCPALPLHISAPALPCPAPPLPLTPALPCPACPLAPAPYPCPCPCPALSPAPARPQRAPQ